MVTPSTAFFLLACNFTYDLCMIIDFLPPPSPLKYAMATTIVEVSKTTNSDPARVPAYGINVLICLVLIHTFGLQTLYIAHVAPVNQ